MTIDWWTLGIQTVNVVILVWLLGRFFWRPVAAMIEQRRATAQRLLAEAEGKRSEATAALAEIERTRAGFAQEREAILAEAHEAAERARAARLEVVAKEAASLEAAAKAAIEKEKAEVDKAWAERASRLAVEIAARLVARLDGLAVRAAFLDLLLAEIRALPDPVRQAVAANGVTLEAISATPLEPADQAALPGADRRGVRSPSADHLQGGSCPHRRPGAARPPPRRDATVGVPTSHKSSRTSRMTSDPDSRADAWLEHARAKLGAAALVPQAEQIGRVEEVGDGIALVSGLPTVRLDELLRFDKGQFGFAQVLERDRVGCVLLDDVDTIEAGDTVRGTGDVVRVPVGPALLGRVVDSLGRPLDGRGPVATDTLEPIERPAPAIIDRDLVTQPVQTGLVVVDTLFALGRGQRELIVGDRAIGKTTIAIDTIINQKTSDIVCVYVAVGQKSSSVRRAIDAIHASGALERCIIVVAGSASSPGLQWIAPFAGFTMAEYFRDRGQHALVVVDDLTKHAASHREIALLTRQSPGREAYPGDVFYVHARLLERAAKLSKEKGGGSLTALPIAETDAGNLSAYIPTNLISITDGQIVLDAKLFHEGQKPAVDVGTSVSRVGGKTQALALREAAETVRLDYAQFLELEIFTRFGGMPDTRVRNQLTRGARIRAILNQPQHAPLRLADEVALVLAVQSGLLDPLPLPAVAEFRSGLRDALDRGAPDAVRLIQESGTLDDARKQALRETLRQYLQSVTPTTPPKAAGQP